MSNISSINGTTNPYQPTSQVNLYLQAFQSVGSALQAGDVSSAQNALTAFQQNLQSYSTSAAQSPFGGNSQANAAYQSLSSALQSGDLSGAQKAFADLQSSLSSVHKGRHHHGARSAQSAPAPTTTQTTSKTSTTSTGGVNASSATDPDGDGDNDGGGLNVTA